MKTKYVDLTVKVGEGFQIRFKDETRPVPDNVDPAKGDVIVGSEYWRTPLASPEDGHKLAIAWLIMSRAGLANKVKGPDGIEREIEGADDAAAALLTFYPGDLATLGLDGLLAKFGHLVT